MSYTPNPKLAINGVDYTSDTINRISINSGRISVEDQPRAGYATVSLIIVDDSHPTINLNDTLEVFIDDSSLSQKSIFKGYITDIERTIDRAGVTGQAVKINLTAAGPLSRLSKQLTASSYSKQYDGDRIAAILVDVFATAWNEVTPTTLTWADVNPATTWLTYDPGYAGTIDTPGDYEMTSYSGGQVEALSLTRNVANSALGVLYETGNGLINYDAASARIDRVISNGFLDLSADYIVSTSVASSTKTSELINSITITYKGNASVTGSDQYSILTYGLFAGQRNTYLELQTQAEQQRDFFLNTRSAPRTSISAVTVPLVNPHLPSPTLDSLIGVYCGSPVAIPDLPNAVYSFGFTGFVEGHSWLITRYTADLTLTLSEYGLSAIEVAWLQVNAAETWQTISNTLTWENASVVY